MISRMTYCHVKVLVNCVKFVVIKPRAFISVVSAANHAKRFFEEPCSMTTTSISIAPKIRYVKLIKAVADSASTAESRSVSVSVWTKVYKRQYISIVLQNHNDFLIFQVGCVQKQKFSS